MEPARPAMRPRSARAARAVAALALVLAATRQAITKAIRTGALPARKIGHEETGTYWIDINDLRALYPPQTRKPGKRTKLRVISTTIGTADDSYISEIDRLSQEAS